MLLELEDELLLDDELLELEEELLEDEPLELEDELLVALVSGLLALWRLVSPISAVGREYGESVEGMK